MMDRPAWKLPSRPECVRSESLLVEHVLPLLFEQHPEPMWLFDPEDLRIVAVNEAALDKYGYSREEFLRLTVRDLRPPEGQEKFNAALSRMLADDNSHQELLKHRRRDGGVLDVEICSSAVQFRGRPARLVVARDVSRLLALEAERELLIAQERRSRAEAEASARRFEAIFQAAPGKFLVLESSEFRIVAASDAYLAATMTRRERILGRRIFDVFPDDPRDARADGVANLRASLEQVRRSGRSDVMAVQRYPIPRPDGQGFEERYWTPVNTPVPDAQGRLEYVIHRVEDVTEFVLRGDAAERERTIRKLEDRASLLEVDILLRSTELRQANLELQSRDAQLRSAQERFELLARATNDIIRDWDVIADTMWWNETFESVCGYPRTEEPSGLDAWTSRLHPQDRARVVASLAASVEGSGSLWSEEYRFLCASGAEMEIIDRAFILRDEAGRALRVIGSMVDVSERRRLEAQLRQAQRLDALGQLTGGVAHDFNNLLTVIVGNAEVLADTLSVDPELQALAQTTLHAALRGAELTSRLLAFARRQALHPQATDIHALLAHMHDLLRRTLGEHLQVHWQNQPGLWHAQVDPAQLEAAVLNLCINARDAMPAGGDLTITTGNLSLDAATADRAPELAPGDYVLIEVRDEGTGMDAQTLSRAFEPFFTTKEVGKGSGLGLSMVYGFTRQSRGHVTIDSEPGAGTAVRLYLPRALPPVQAPANDHPDPARASSKGRILLVEDDELVRAHGRAQLEALGYVVDGFAGAREALEALKAGEYDLLFTDVMMPGGMSGRQLADAARAVAPALPVLLTSGYSDALAEDHYPPRMQMLPKPYRRRDLAARLQALLDPAAATPAA